VLPLRDISTPPMAFGPCGGSEESHLRNVPQEPEGQGSPSPLLRCHPAHKDRRGSPSIHASSIHPRLSGRGGTRSGPTDVSCRQVEDSLTRAPLGAVQGPPSEPGVPRQLNLSSGQSEGSGSRPISLHYGPAALLRCRVPVVLQGRRCLIHHQGTKGQARGGGCGEEVGPSCP